MARITKAQKVKLLKTVLDMADYATLEEYSAGMLDDENATMVPLEDIADLDIAVYNKCSEDCLIALAGAKEYSLGCDCVYLLSTGIELLEKEMAKTSKKVVKKKVTKKPVEAPVEEKTGPNYHIPKTFSTATLLSLTTKDRFYKYFDLFRKNLDINALELREFCSFFKKLINIHGEWEGEITPSVNASGTVLQLIYSLGEDVSLEVNYSLIESCVESYFLKTPKNSFSLCRSEYKIYQ